MAENERESLEGGSDSMTVAMVIVSSGEANLSREIGEHGEGYESGSDGLAIPPSSPETKCSSDKVASAGMGRSPNPPATVSADLHGGVA